MKKTSSYGALLTSFVSLLLCCVMLLGTTFAWFTDTVTTTNNIIQSGSLDIEFEYSENLTSWTEIDSTSEVLNNSAIWEPGFTDVVYLRVKNVGDLAVKYQFGVNIVEEKGGVNKADEAFKLSDYINFGVIEMSSTDVAFADRDEAVAAITNAKKLGAGLTDAGALLAEENKTYALVVYMPAETGNVANYKKGNDDANRPLIKLGLSAYATQLTKEQDSFDELYDAGAPWIGVSDVSWYLENPDATEFVITTAEELAGFASIVNGTATGDMVLYSTTPATFIDSFKGKTVKLGANIDLDNLAWTPIGDVDADDYVGFQGTFDGQGHIISNLNINSTSWGQGLFGYLQEKGAVIKNFRVHNASVKAADTSAVVAGYATFGTFSNIGVTGDVTVEGKEHMGVIVGNGYYANFDNCYVDTKAGSTVTTTTGSFVGGIVGYHGELGLAIKNCSVKNINITGFAAVGGITGLASASNTIDGCSVENVTLTKTRDGGNQAIGLIAGCYAYNPNKPNTITNCTAKSVTLNGNYEGVKNILHGSEYSGQTVTNFVIDGIVTENITDNLVELVETIRVTTVEELKTAFANVTAPVVIDATGVVADITSADFFEIPCGITLKGLTVNAKYRGGNYVVFKNGTAGPVVLEDCSFGNSDRSILLCADDDTVDSIIFNNCTFKGQVLSNQVNNPDGVSEFNNCLFTKSDSSPYNFTEGMGGTHVFNNSTFDYTGVNQSSMGVINNGSVNVYSESGYSTTVILNSCTRTNCGTRKYGSNSTLTIK